MAVVRNDNKRAILEKWGQKFAIYKDVDVINFHKAIFEETKQRVGYPAVNVDIVVDCAGLPTNIDDFLKMRKHNCRLSIVGVCQEPALIPLARIMSAEVIIQGACAYMHEDIQEVIENLASKKAHG